MSDLNNILSLLEENRGFDFSGYRTSMLNRRIQKRIFATNSADLSKYKEYLEQDKSEFDKLIDVLTINVSRFFRDAFVFEYFTNQILQKLILEKKHSNDRSLRVWSAGCAAGEEPYSIAILIKDIFEKEKLSLNTTIIATDIDKKILKSAKEGIYSTDSIKNVKYSILKKYFVSQDSTFKLKSEIKDMVSFSEFDMLNKKYNVPPDSVYGDFDVVLCRNLLIYYNTDYQDIIYNKLFKSLSNNGIIFLGEAEVPSNKFKNKFNRTSKFSKIYKIKNGL